MGKGRCKLFGALLFVAGCAGDEVDDIAKEDGSGGGDDDDSASSGQSDDGDDDDDQGDDDHVDEEEPPIDGDLEERLETVAIDVAEGVREGDRNWRVWSLGSLHVAPVFSVPLANCDTLVCYTAESAGMVSAQLLRLGPDDSLESEMTLAEGLHCRGLAAEPDGNFAALLWDGGAEEIFVKRYNLEGEELWSTQLVNADNDPTDFGIGESRLEFGGGQYGAYYHVHSNTGHEGDTLKWVSASSGDESTEWSWGCSHSMSNLLRYSPEADRFLPACVTDCFPGTDGDFGANSIGGIYLNHRAGKVIDVDAGCNGRVAGELGSAAIASAGWKMVFNAHQADAGRGQSSYEDGDKNQDIGFASVSRDFEPGEVVWLTSTDSIDEADSSIARWQPDGDEAEQYLVGWAEPSEGDYSYRLARIDAEGEYLETPIDVSATVQWGRRDDPFRQHLNKDVVWAWFEDPGSTTLHFARVDSGQQAECADF